METTESPLDVLSRAATMVQDHSSEVGAAGADASPDARPSPHKELPTTRWRRERRTRQARERPASSCSSGATAPGPGDAAATATAPAAALPPAGTRARTAAAAAAAASAAQPNTRAASGPPPLLPLRQALAQESASGFPIRSSPPSPEVLVARTAPDSPLDMSTRSRGSPPPYSCPSGPPRPSVITCAPAASGSPSGNHSWNQQPESGNSNRQGHRRELLSGGMCDPVIDEHFRRSLGKDYLSIFRDEGSETSDAPDQKDSAGSNSNSITVTGLSVDDHFAKALGDTWVKLQEQSATEAVTRSSSTTNLARDKKQGALPQQPQQPPARGIVSI